MEKLKGLLLLLISVMVLNGCIVPQYISYDDVVRDSKSEDYFVRIYEDGELEEGDYKVIGEVIINGGVDVSVMMEDIRNKVREIGGDGIIDLLVNGSNGLKVVETFTIPLLVNTSLYFLFGNSFPSLSV